MASEQVQIAQERRQAADALRRRRDELLELWMEKVRLLTHEKGAEGFAAEQVIHEEAGEFIELVLDRLEGRAPEADIGAFYRLILQERERNVRLADVAYVLLELKSVAKHVIFRDLDDELEAFRACRLVDDTVEAILRKSADLYELSIKADHLTARERLQEIFAAWDVEEALAGAQSLAEVGQLSRAKLSGIWNISDCGLFFREHADAPLQTVRPAPELPVPAVREQQQYLTEREVAAGGALKLPESCCRRREICVSSDLRDDQRFVNAPELLEEGARSLACLPLVCRDRVLGAALLYGEQPNAFQERDRRSLGDVANVIAMAVDRTSRLERSRKEISEAEVIARIGRSLLELPTGEALLQGVAEALRAFRDYFDVSLFRVDREAGECALVAEAGRGRRYRPEEYRQGIGEGFIGICAERGETIRASDLEEDSRRLIAFEEEYRARTELAVPIRKGEQVLGVIHILSERENDFPDSEIGALENVAPHIGVALQNASMIVQRRRDRYEVEQAHRHVANIVRSTAVGITSTDIDGVYTHWSPSCEALLGYQEQEVVGRKTPADLAAAPYDLGEALRRCLEEGRSVVERELVRKDGAHRIVRETRVPMTDEQGRHIGFTSYLLDITERKKARDQLRRERDTLNLVVDAMGAGLALFDNDLCLQWANTTMMDWFDFGPEVFGRVCHEVPICTDCQGEDCPILGALEKGRPQSRVQELAPEAGQWRCYQQVFTPVSHGETRLVALTLEITEQRRQTDQLRLINKLTEKVEASLDLDTVLYLVLTCVTAGHAIGMNRAFLFLLGENGRRLEGRMAVGPTSGEEAQRIWEDLEESTSGIEELLEIAEPSRSDRLLTRRTRRLEVPLSDQEDALISTLRARTGAYVSDARDDPRVNPRLAETLELEEFVCVPLASGEDLIGLMLADNKYTGAPIDQEQVELLEMFSRQASLAIANARAYERIRDQLVELRETRDRLIEAERLASIGRMASHLAHEIRNPLTAIGGFASSIVRRHEEGSLTQRNARIIYKEAQRLERTLRNVLDFSRPLRPEKAPFCLNEVIRDTIEEFKDQLREGGVTLRSSLDPELPEVMADPEMIKQVIVNLVKNALEAMDGSRGGVLSVATMRSTDRAEIIIGDTGEGMEQDTVEKLFSPFFTTKVTGVGLGMAVCQRIVQQHGSRIEVESELGRGSQFSFALPLAGSAQEEAAPPPAAAEGDTKRG